MPWFMVRVLSLCRKQKMFTTMLLWRNNQSLHLTSLSQTMLEMKWESVEWNNFMIINDFGVRCVEDTVMFERASKLDKITDNLTSHRALRLYCSRISSQCYVYNCEQCTDCTQIWCNMVYHAESCFNGCFAGRLLTVYISKLDMGSAVTLYRFSLNATVPAPWTALTPDHGEVPSFQVTHALSTPVC